MGKSDKILDRVLQGIADASIRFDDLRSLLRRLGFEEHIRGDHHIFTKTEVAEILNLQPRGGQAKPYQVKQVRGVILKYRLAGDSPAKASAPKMHGRKKPKPPSTETPDAH